ncbi:MAG: tRNA dimethylallyltransferase, partial [Thermodesulfobacteriota bacterium]
TIEIRQRWRKAASEHGPEFLWEEVRKNDLLAAGRIHPRDTFRLIRALEVLELTGRPISEWQQWGHEAEPDFEILWIGLSMEREVLYRNINLRTEAMMNRGFLDEVQGLLEKGYAPELKSMQSLGYRHLVEAIKGIRNLKVTVDLIKRDTRRYAKRQLTWLAKEENLTWYSPQEFDKIRLNILKFLKQTENHDHP